MNKPYFAVYLPVEGEIKEGDYFYNPATKETLFASSDMLSWNSDTTQEHKGWKKVKLFLCSKDIQAGEKFTQIGIDMIHPTARFTCVEHDDYGQIICDEGRHWAKNTIYKVIGEISPDATWVKEGDKFGEGEIHKCEVSNMLVNPPEPIIWYAIKGPCGHFH